MQPCLAQQIAELLPAGRIAGPTLYHHVIDQPAFQPAAPGPDIDLDPVFLHVGAGGQEQAPSGTVPGFQSSFTPCRRCQSGASPVSNQVSPRIVFRNARIASSLPCAVSHARAIRVPAEPAHRRIERREVIADGQRVGRRRVARHTPRSSISVLRCSEIGCSQPSQWYSAVSGRPFSQRSRSNFSHCSWPQCGHGT